MPVRPRPAGSQRLRVPSRQTRIVIAALFLVSINLRAAITSIPPLVTTIQSATGLTGFGAGVLTTLPIACMGLFAPLAASLVRRIGPERTISVALGILTLGIALRIGAGQVLVLYASTLVAGIGIATLGAVLPSWVKTRFAAHSGPATAVYTTGMTVGATLAAAVSVPAANWLDSWPRSLALWAIPAAIAVLIWMAVVPTTRPDHRSISAPMVRVWHSRAAWILAFYMAVQSCCYYGVVAWVPAAYEDHGVSETSAGLLFSLCSAVGLVTSLVGPILMNRVRDRRIPFVAGASMSAIGLVVFALWPGFAPPLVMIVVGLGVGAGFPLGLVLLVDYAAGPLTSARLSGMVFLVCYVTAALAPAGLGALHDALGSYRVPFLILTAAAVVQLVLSLDFVPGRRLDLPPAESSPGSPSSTG